MLPLKLTLITLLELPPSPACTEIYLCLGKGDKYNLTATDDVKVAHVDHV